MKCHVLIIDDDESFRKLLQMKLRSFMPDPVFTIFDRLATARIHLQAMTELYFDLVIIDEHLGDGRGVDLLAEGWFKELAVLSVSSDPSPEIPGSALSAGATFFLSKQQITEKLFQPLIIGVLERNRLQRQLIQQKVTQAELETVKTLVATLRHEINNPLGAVLGGAFLLRKYAGNDKDGKEAADIVESSGKRIQHVLEQLCKSMQIETIEKAQHKVFQIPGDKPWLK